MIILQIDRLEMAFMQIENSYKCECISMERTGATENVADINRACRELCAWVIASGVCGLVSILPDAYWFHN